MARKARNPGAGRRQGFGLDLVSQAVSKTEYSPSPILGQGEIDLVLILAARARVAVPTARLFAELNQFASAP